jgi:LysR family transcriptional regulator, benzoate and cis,cis-muconate-responsive activator of ben and cat genes
MDLRQLRNFVAVAELGNISQAAKRIHLTQSALSRQIKALEDEIGHSLLQRKPHSIRLTPTGELLLREGRELLRYADQMLERVRLAGSGVRLRIGYAPSLAAGMLSTAVENFTQSHPQARVDLLDLSTAEMLAGLENGSLDVAISVGEQHPEPGLKWTPLVEVHWRLAVSRTHRLARRSKVTPLEVAAEPLIGFCQRDYPEYWAAITRWLRKSRQRPKIAGEYEGTENLMAAVESGLGVAFITTQVARLFPNRTSLLTLHSPPKPVCVAVGHRTDRTEDKPLAVFVAELRKAALTPR